MERASIFPVTSRGDRATSGSGRFVGLSGEESLNGGSSIISPSRKYENSACDKHTERESLQRNIGKEVELDDGVLINIISSVCQETLRKKRARLHLFNDYMKEKNLCVKEILAGRVDVKLAKALSWREEKGGTKMLHDARKTKTHVGIALCLFSEIHDVAQSPMIQTIVKRLSFDKQSKVKFDRIQQIKQLFKYIEFREMKNGGELMQKAVALIVAFSAIRKTELAAITRKCITQEAQDMKIMIVTKKR
ncbi:MAG: hypothetical protein EZS28_049014, partial [Streblomastix strix]